MHKQELRLRMETKGKEASKLSEMPPIYKGTFKEVTPTGRRPTGRRLEVDVS